MKIGICCSYCCWSSGYERLEWRWSLHAASRVSLVEILRVEPSTCQRGKWASSWSKPSSPGTRFEPSFSELLMLLFPQGFLALSIVRVRILEDLFWRWKFLSIYLIGGGRNGGVQRLIDWGFFEDAKISEIFCASSKTTRKRQMRFLIGKSTISYGFLVFHGFG